VNPLVVEDDEEQTGVYFELKNRYEIKEKRERKKCPVYSRALLQIILDLAA